MVETHRSFGGVRPVIHVPFGAAPAQAVLRSELRALALRMLNHGADGLVILGLASEAWALTEGERDELVADVAEVCAGRAPFVVGLDGATAIAVDRGRRARAAGAAGLMVLPPAGARSTDQLRDHYCRLADTVGVPILIQDSPQVTGVNLPIDALVAIAEAHPLLRSLKIEIAGAGGKVSAAIATGIEVVAGWGGFHYLEQLRRGASGCMPGCDFGPAFVQIDRLANGGQAAQAEELYRRLVPLLSYAVQSLELLLLTTKRLLRRQGIFSTESLRSPARALDVHEAETIDALIDQLASEGTPGFEGIAS